jgi:hypothetical protein
VRLTMFGAASSGGDETAEILRVVISDQE